MASIILSGADANISGDLERLVEKYFYTGLTYAEICLFLQRRHGIVLSVNQLKNRLRFLGLKRRGISVPLGEVEDAIAKEKRDGGKNLGYRAMWLRLHQKHHLRVPRDVVMFVCRQIDPVGVEDRKRRRLKRRVYVNKGPNYLWHMDGYDKLKPYGFCIHGCIDGFSRRILWLHVATTNNDPLVISGYYLRCIRSLNGVPRLLRSDRGTETVTVAGLQSYLRHKDADEMSGSRSFMYGKSTANQRIEAWWGHLRRSGAGFWIDYFKDLQDSGEFDSSSQIHKDCLRYCFMDMLQEELDRIKAEWNFHRLKKSKNAESPGGIPEMLYFTPEIEGAESSMFPLDEDDYKAADTAEHRTEKPAPYSNDFRNLADVVLRDENVTKPNTPEEGKAAFTLLVRAITDGLHELR